MSPLKEISFSEKIFILIRRANRPSCSFITVLRYRRVETFLNEEYSACVLVEYERNWPNRGGHKHENESQLNRWDSLLITNRQKVAHYFQLRIFSASETESIKEELDYAEKKWPEKIDMYMFSRSWASIEDGFYPVDVIWQKGMYIHI